MVILDKIKQVFSPKQVTVDVNDLPQYDAAGGHASANYSNFDGDKFAGGFGATQLFDVDYWTLRERSGQLFKENLYGRGLIRRLVTNEINTGLMLDSTPSSELIPGMDEEGASVWAEDIEIKWQMFADDPRVCDYLRVHNEGRLQQFIRRESLIDGDILCVQRYNAKTGHSSTQLVRGEYVRTPPGWETNPANNNDIKHGCELDPEGRVVAHWIEQDDGTFERLPAYGAKTGRKISWLIYGTDLRFGEVRGEPLLSIVLQSLKEIDRYRDSAQRKAVINSMLAMYVTKNADKMGTKPLTNAGIRRDSVAAPSADQPNRKLNFNSHLPGIYLDELQVGEEPKAFGPDGTDINFPVFEAAVIQAVAWACEMPPEILTLQFSNNYSASQAAINEFKIYLNASRSYFSAQYCIPRYHEWLYNELAARRVIASGLLLAWNDLSQYQFVGAWRSSDWTGAIKPSTDIVKQTKGYKEQIGEGLITREKAAKELNGSKFRHNVRRLKREAGLLAEAMKPLVELQQTAAANTDSHKAITDTITQVMEDFTEQMAS